MLPIHVPSFIALVLAFGLPHWLHFKLITAPKLSNRLVMLGGLALFVGIPLLFPAQDKDMDGFIRGSNCVYFMLRALEIANVPRSMNSKWDAWNYTEFMINSDNEMLRLQRQTATASTQTAGTSKKSLKAARWTPFIAYPEDRGVLFYVWWWSRLLVTVLAFSFAQAYFLLYPYKWPYGQLLSLFDLNAVVMHLMFVALLYGQVMIFYNLWKLSVAILLKISYSPIFDAPYLSTSLQDFWSHRWNARIKSALHKAVFLPVLAALESSHSRRKRTSSNHNRSPAMINAMIATMATFIVSGIFHEYCVFVFIDNTQGGSKPRYGENMVFFLLHGVLCVTQVFLAKLSKFGETWGNGLIWKFISWLATVSILLITCPLLAAPMGRSGLLLSVPMPSFLVDTFKAVLWMLA
ncbi:hypothetical protein BDR26DRAFT_856876 [Obelidium mucronatum]|nr:hypothetical protein BDR26DRAFT_856876 [Obelidium mucronatum]